MPDYEVKMQAIATAVVLVYDVESAQEAEEEAELMEFDKGEIEKLTDFEVLEITEEKPFGLPVEKKAPDAS